MKSDILFKNILRFVALMLLQILVLNNVWLGGYAIPFLYILFVIMLPVGMGRKTLLVIAFVTGLIMDLFCNMLGFHTFACTLTALVRILFADRILTRNEAVEIDIPSIYSVKPQYFVTYLLVLSAFFYTTYFLIELFEGYGLWQLLLSIVCSTLLTGLLAILWQLLFVKKER